MDLYYFERADLMDYIGKDQKRFSLYEDWKHRFNMDRALQRIHDGEDIETVFYDELESATEGFFAEELRDWE